MEALATSSSGTPLPSSIDEIYAVSSNTTTPSSMSSTQSLQSMESMPHLQHAVAHLTERATAEAEAVLLNQNPAP